MRLAEALQIAGQTAGDRQRPLHLLTGFSPLHLATFTKACLRLRFPQDGIRLHTGLYGDLEGNLQRAREIEAEGALTVIEWSDLDQRLGLRNSSGWSAKTLDDVVVQVEERCARLQPALEALAQQMPVLIVPPTLPLPPLTHLPPLQAGSFELNLQAILAGFLRRIGQTEGVRVLNSSALDSQSPPSARHDVKSDLHYGFPYSLAHADILTRLCIECLFPAPLKKGLITDLDQTLWKGILGEDGVEGISWSLESKSQAHALYQQMLASLAESGVLLAIASKNDPALVEAALARPDLLIPPAQIFPIEAGWGAKSEAVSRILKAWNIGADSVIFIDDSPMELAEVAEKFPAMECLPFPANDPAAVVALLYQLRTRFGKNEIREEDRLRLQSLRAAEKLAQEKPLDASLDFLSRLNAKLIFETSASDARAFELVNKTNQFNLNGRRFTEAEWKALQQLPGAFLVTVSYEDRFGPLGRIAVIGGRMDAGCCSVDLWVMSCRAFSRQIEFQMLRRLFAKSGAAEILFHFQPTDRNGPLQNFFRQFFKDSIPQGELELPSAVFEKACPPLFHQVIEI
jgi:FkbH-like protein